MKLLQNCWSEILILDLVHRLVRQIWSGELVLVSNYIGVPYFFDYKMEFFPSKTIPKI